MSKRIGEGNFVIPEICVTSYDDKLEENNVFKNTSVSPPQSRGSGSKVKVSRTMSLPALRSCSRNKTKPNRVTRKGDNNFDTGSSTDVFKCQDRSKGQRLWQKATDSLKLPLLYVNVKEKRLSLGIEIGESLAKRQYSRRRYKLTIYSFQKRLLAKFKLAVKLAIFCSRNFKQHCLR